VDSALWHRGSRLVAVTDGGTKTSKELYVYELREADAGVVSTVERVALPDYEQNALRRVGATAIFKGSSMTPTRWVDAVLESSLAYDALRQQGGRPTELLGNFEVTVWIEVQWRRSLNSPTGPGRNEPATARLDRMGLPHPVER
jgi:hypothetical protein